MSATKKVIKMKPELLSKFNRAKKDGYTFNEHSRKFGGRNLITHYTAYKDGTLVATKSSVAVLLKSLNY